MKIQIKLLSLITLALLVFSCKSKFSTIAPYKEVAIIWALLDLKDTAHYIKIEKGFVNEDQNAYSIAQNPDSIYFSELDVKVEEIANGNVINSIVLQKVNLVNEGIVKDTGIFSVKNVAYKFKRNLNKNYTYRIVAKTPYKEFRAISNAFIDSFNTFTIKPVFLKDSSFRTTANPAGFFNVIWTTINNAQTFDSKIVFHYYEVDDRISLDTLEKKFTWALFTNHQDMANLKKSVYWEDLYTKLNALESSSHIKRWIGKFEFYLYAGSDRLLNYINQNNAQFGLTSTQINPKFKEGFETEDTYGLVATRASYKSYNLNLSDTTLVLFQTDNSTAGLNFVGKR